MPPAVYRTLLCACTIGTNPALLHLPWMRVGGWPLAVRAALSGRAIVACRDRAVDQAWAALMRRGWASGALLGRCAKTAQAERRWQPRRWRTMRAVSPIPCPPGTAQ